MKNRYKDDSKPFDLEKLRNWKRFQLRILKLLCEKDIVTGEEIAEVINKDKNL